MGTLRATSTSNLNVNFCTLKMASFKDTRDFILLSYDMGLINDVDFLLLYPMYISQNLELPYNFYPPFNIEDLNEDECLAEFRFKKADIPVLAEALQIPDVIRCNQGTVCDGVEGLCMLLSELPLRSICLQSQCRSSA